MKEFKLGRDSREAILEGVEKLYQVVSCTLGPGGKNVLIERPGNFPESTKDGVTVARHYSSPDSYENVGIMACKQAALRANEVAGDGPQPLYSKVLTPDGFVEMGSLKVGDKICGTQGSFQEVTGVFPKGKKEIYKVKLFDDREVECCEDHLWKVADCKGNWSTLTTKQLLENKVVKKTKEGHNYHQYYLPIDSVELNPSKLILDPYLMGLRLGDGSLTGPGSIGDVIDEITVPSQEVKVHGFESHSLGLSEYSSPYSRVKSTGLTKEGETTHKLISELDPLDTKSETKFIPPQYLYTDLGSRKRLLQGLTDSAGYVDEEGLLEYNTSSLQLAKDVTTLLHSLGKSSRLHKYKRTGNSFSNTPIYRVTEMKGQHYGVAIKDIVATGEFTEMQCIKVSNPDCLYFTDNFVLTHNTTSSTILTRELLVNGLELLEKGANPHTLRKGMANALMAIKEILDEKSKKITYSDVEMLEKVATISGNDSKIGEIVSSAFNQTGEGGFVSFEIGDKQETYIAMAEGMKFDGGYDSPYYITDPIKRIVQYEDPVVVIIEKVITNANDVVSFIENLAKYMQMAMGGIKPIVIVSKGVQGDALATLYRNYMEGRLQIVSIAPRVFGGDELIDLFSDLAAFCGTNVAIEKLVSNVGDLDPQAITGVAKRITVSELETTIVMHPNNEEKIEKHLDTLKQQEGTEKRVSNLQAKVAIIKVGASTYSEVKELKDRYEDAVNACKAALIEGVLPGGGVSLIKAAKLASEKIENGLGEQLVFQSCAAPHKKLFENSGAFITSSLPDLDDFTYTYDGLTGDIVDATVSGILDPTKVLKSSLESAVNIAGLYLTTDCVMIEKSPPSLSH